jgi:transcriptional regulator with XRE-family HTH domain
MQSQPEGYVNGMKPSDIRERHDAYALAVAQQLRQSRNRQRLTQSEVSLRTGGAISKAALANYETGHRSLRVEVFWALAHALGEDPGALLAAADRAVGSITGDGGPITVDVDAILQSADPRLSPVRRWFGMRLQSAVGSRIPVNTLVLDSGAIGALAALMGVSDAECRVMLHLAGDSHARFDRARTAS